MATLLLLVARKGARFNFLYVSHSLCSCTGSVEAFAELGLDAKRAESDATGQMGIPAYGPKGTSAKGNVLEETKARSSMWKWRIVRVCLEVAKSSLTRNWAGE